MLRAWRVTKTRNVGSAFTGEGARLFGSRWTSPGLPVAFASESLSLATLEVLVHLGSEPPLSAYSCFELAIPENVVEALDRSRLPANWRISPAPAGLQTIGNRWLAAGRSAVLRVPSAIVPSESDFMMNPGHPAFRQIRIGPPQEHFFDPRLLGRKRLVSGERVKPAQMVAALEVEKGHRDYRFFFEMYSAIRATPFSMASVEAA